MPATFVPTIFHIRNVLLFLYFSKVGKRDAEKQIAAVYPDDCPSYRTIERWYANFEKEKYCIDDEARPGRPCDLDLEKLKSLVESDPFQSTRSMAAALGFEHHTICTGLHKLGKAKKLGRFIPHHLSIFDYDRRIDACSTLLTFQKGKNWLNHIITGDEKWIYFDNHVRKAQWVDVCEEPADVPKPDLHPKKVMLCIWWTVQGPLHWELLPIGTTIDADVYSTQLKNLKKKVDSSAFGRHKVYFQHDNARPHVARKVVSELTRFGWTILPHPPYSPDLAPSDYCLFSDLQRHLQGKEFQTVDEVENELKLYLASKPRQFYTDCIHRLLDRWQFVVDNDGKYN
jgi:histone-lysine N-methyltransferase SETMAR